jgi:molybdate transport system substrate-binding protein
MLPAKDRRISISVPCSIFAAFCEILDEYKKEHPDVKISFDTGNTIILMRNVLYKNARPDVYISTGPLEIEPLLEKGLVEPGTKMALTFDSVILVAPASNPKGIKGIEDLRRSDVAKIAIPEPATNSSGNYAVAALKRAGVWDDIKQKVTFTEFGKHTRNYIMEGKIDAGVLYRSCLYEDLKAYEEVIAPKEIYVVSDILAGADEKIPSFICILKASKNKKLAREFMNYMLSPKAKAILRKWEGRGIENK